MNDKQIEDLLRGSWSPEPPDGMRDRTLRGSRSAQERQPMSHRWVNWRAGFVTAGLLLIVLTSLLDVGTQRHLAQICGEKGRTGSAMLAQRQCTIGNWRTLSICLASGGEGTKGDQLP